MISEHHVKLPLKNVIYICPKPHINFRFMILDPIHFLIYDFRLSDFATQF